MTQPVDATSKKPCCIICCCKRKSRHRYQPTIAEDEKLKDVARASFSASQNSRSQAKVVPIDDDGKSPN